MAITYPSASYRQLPGKSTASYTPRIINLHTMVGTLAGTETYFAQSGRPYSHFGVGGSGEVRQWQNLAYRAASDLDGNPISISIETEDKGPLFPAWTGSNVPRWTPLQAKEIARLVAWLCARFGIRPVLLSDSLPGRVGPSYHRLGIDPWRLPAGIRYSSAYGKVCPGDRRIAQLAGEVMPLVQALLGQPPPPPPPLPPEEDDDMKPYIQGDPQGSQFYIWENVVVFLGNGQTRVDYEKAGYDFVNVADPEDAAAIREGHRNAFTVVRAPTAEPLSVVLQNTPEVPPPVDADPNP